MVLRYLMTRTWMSVLCLVVAVPAATFDYFSHGHFDPWEWTALHGANTDLACRVIAYSGVAAIFLRRVLRKVSAKDWYGRALATLLVLEAGALTFAVGLLLADSATYVLRQSYDTSAPALVRHVYGLLVASGVALVFVLLRAFGAWTGVERPRRTTTWALPLS